MKLRMVLEDIKLYCKAKILISFEHIIFFVSVALRMYVVFRAL